MNNEGTSVVNKIIHYKYNNINTNHQSFHKVNFYCYFITVVQADNIQAVKGNYIVAENMDELKLCKKKY